MGRGKAAWSVVPQQMWASPFMNFKQVLLCETNRGLLQKLFKGEGKVFLRLPPNSVKPFLIPDDRPKGSGPPACQLLSLTLMLPLVWLLSCMPSPHTVPVRAALMYSPKVRFAGFSFRLLFWALPFHSCCSLCFLWTVTLPRQLCALQSYFIVFNLCFPLLFYSCPFPTVSLVCISS